LSAISKWKELPWKNELRLRPSINFSADSEKPFYATQNLKKLEIHRTTFYAMLNANKLEIQ
jgi:hypothetical protein